MTIRVGKFEKISIGQFDKDVKNPKITYNELPLPVRATKGSASTLGISYILDNILEFLKLIYENILFK